MSTEGLIITTGLGFFLKSLSFQNGALTITYGASNKDLGRIIFDHVRLFLVFRESDFFRELAKYEHTQIIYGGERTLGVFRINKSPVLASLVGDRLDEEQPLYYWVSTPDECIEVVGFSEPHITANIRDSHK